MAKSTVTPWRRARAWLVATFVSLCAAICAIGFSHAAVDNGVEIRLQVPTQSDLVLPWSLAISGTWPTACLPEVEHVSVDGNDLRVDIRNRKSVCATQPTPFALAVAPSGSVGLTMLPPGTYRVSVYAAQGVHAAPHLLAFSLIENLAADVVATPESGYWWAQPEAGSTVSPGTGLMIELQGRTLTVSALSYDSAGAPVWYLGTGLLQSSIAHVPLLHAQGGNSLFGGNNEPSQASAAMNLDLEFQSSGRAIAWFSRSAGSGADNDGIEVRSLALARMAFADPPDGHVWQGDWILVPDDPLKNAQRVHFDQVQTQSEQSFRLSDSTSETELSCWRDLQRPSAPPQSCTLQGAQGRTLAQFNAVAIGRLEGVMPDNGRVKLIRLNP